MKTKESKRKGAEAQSNQVGHAIYIDFKPVKSSLHCGLRVEWLSGKTKGAEIELTTGAGVGSPYLIFTKTTKDGKQVALVADIRTIIDELDAAANSELRASASLR